MGGGRFASVRTYLSLEILKSDCIDILAKEFWSRSITVVVRYDKIMNVFERRKPDELRIWVSSK